MSLDAGFWYILVQKGTENKQNIIQLGSRGISDTQLRNLVFALELTVLSWVVTSVINFHRGAEGTQVPTDHLALNPIIHGWYGGW